MLDVKISKKAYQDYFKAFEWYEEQEPGLGDSFEFAIFREINSIAKHPLFYPSKAYDTREKKVRGFPFIIIYRISSSKNLIEVVSIFHTKRNPKKKY